jgi:hypothetical protein
MKISQREARRLQQQVAKLEKQLDEQLRHWSSSWPGGVHIRTLDASAAHHELRVAIKTARMLDHAVVCTTDGTNIMFYGLPLPQTK